MNASRIGSRMRVRTLLLGAGALTVRRGAWRGKGNCKMQNDERRTPICVFSPQSLNAQLPSRRVCCYLYCYHPISPVNYHFPENTRPAAIVVWSSRLPAQARRLHHNRPPEAFRVIRVIRGFPTFRSVFTLFSWYLPCFRPNLGQIGIWRPAVFRGETRFCVALRRFFVFSVEQGVSPPISHSLLSTPYWVLRTHPSSHDSRLSAGHYSMFTDGNNSCSHLRSICRRKCLQANELRGGRLFARRPPGETEEGRKLAATAYAVRSWKKSAVWHGARKNSGPRKNFIAKVQRTRNNHLAQGHQGVFALSYENSPLSLRERARVRAFRMAGARCLHNNSAFFRGKSVWRNRLRMIECGHATNCTIDRDAGETAAQNDLSDKIVRERSPIPRKLVTMRAFFLPPVSLPPQSLPHPVKPGMRWGIC